MEEEKEDPSERDPLVYGMAADHDAAHGSCCEFLLRCVWMFLWRMRPFKASITLTLSKERAPSRPEQLATWVLLRGHSQRGIGCTQVWNFVVGHAESDRREHPTQVPRVMIKSPKVQDCLSQQPLWSVRWLAAFHKLSKILIFFERQQFPSSASRYRLQLVPAIASFLPSTSP